MTEWNNLSDEQLKDVYNMASRALQQAGNESLNVDPRERAEQARANQVWNQFREWLEELAEEGRRRGFVWAKDEQGMWRLAK